MMCPKCDVDNNSVFRTDDNAYLRHVRRGRLCHNCKHVFETTERATGDNYFKRKSDELTPDLFEEHLERQRKHAALNRVKRDVKIIKRKGTDGTET